MEERLLYGRLQPDRSIGERTCDRGSETKCKEERKRPLQLDERQRRSIRHAAQHARGVSEVATPNTSTKSCKHTLCLVVDTLSVY